MQEVRRRLRKYRDLRDLGPEHRRVQHRRRNLRHRLRPPGTGPQGAFDVRGEPARPPGIPRAHRRRHDAEARQARAAGRDRPGPRRGPSRRPGAGRDGGPAHGRRGRGGLALPRPRQQRGLRRRSSGSGRRTAPIPGRSGGSYVPREDGGIVQLDSVARIEQVQSASRIDRLDRQREVRLRGLGGARVRAGRPAGGAARRGGGDEPARRPTRRAFPAGGGSSSGRSASSSGPSPCRSSSCT